MLTTNLGVGGAQNVFYEHARAFHERYEVTECYFSFDQGESPNKHINRVITLDNKPAGGCWNKLVSLIRRVRKVRALKKADEYLACISHMDGANWVNVFSGKPHGVRVISVIHGSLVSDRNRGAGLRKFFLNRILVPLVYKRSTLVVCVSDTIKKELDQYTMRPDLSVSLPNYFDIEQVLLQSGEEIEAEWKMFFHSYKVLISVARLAPEKNHLALLKLYARIRKCDSAYRLVFIGDGVLYDSLVEAAVGLGLSTYNYKSPATTDTEVEVAFLGMRSNPYKYLRSGFAFLLTSFNEGFPLVLGEAMACRLPVIAYDCISGPKQILAPDFPAEQDVSSLYFGSNGILVPRQRHERIEEDEINSWVAATLRLSSDVSYYKKVQNSAFARVLSFSKQNVLQKWHKHLLGCKSSTK